MVKLITSKNKFVVGALIILGITSIVMGIYATKKYIDKNVNQELTKKEYQKYYSEVYSESLYFDYYLSNEYPIKDVNELSDLNKTYLALKIICPYTGYTVTTKDVEKELGKHFINYKLYKNDVKIQDTLHYQFKDDIYTFSNDTLKKYGVVTKEISALGTNNNFIIEKKIYYTKKVFENNQYFNRVYASNKLTKVLYQNTTEQGGLSDEEFEKIKKDLTTLTYKFERVNNHYYLKSITSNNKL